MFMTDFNFPKLQNAAFKCLTKLGYLGIKVNIYFIQFLVINRSYS